MPSLNCTQLKMFGKQKQKSIILTWFHGTVLGKQHKLRFPVLYTKISINGNIVIYDGEWIELSNYASRMEHISHVG